MQAAGAVAMVVVNNVPDSAVAMGSGFSTDASQVTIPCVMMYPYPYPYPYP